MSRKLIEGTPQDDRRDGTDFADVIYGYGGDDLLIGHHGNDTIYGGKGDDTIYGGQDHDEIWGGDGKDDFMFNKLEAKDSDTIMDFQSGPKKTIIDQIGLDGTVFDDFQNGKITAGQFVEGRKALDGNDHLIYNPNNHNLYYDEDGKGGHKQVLLAHFENSDDVAAKDFLIFF